MFLSMAAVVIGSQACQPCHSALVDRYLKTPMARSSGRTDSLSLAPANFIAGGQRYQIANNQLTFTNSGDQIVIPLAFFIGSGAAGRTFLFARDRYLFELPVTWYSRKKVWDVSPGYEGETGVKLNRAIEPSCLACHSSRVRPIFGTQNRYGETPFLEDGVSCERCHGPGSEHVSNPKLNHLVNPVKLTPELRDSVCSQCHLTGDARIEQAGRRVQDFRAGELLASYATYFVRGRSPAGLKVTSHVEKLAASECKRVSGDKLWCGTCHDPHAADNSQSTRVKTQVACLNCHGSAHHAEENCASCHMPKSPVIDGGHGVLTDHGISLSRASSRPSSSPAASTDLSVFLGNADNRSLGLAYAELGDPRARAYLMRAQPADSEVRLQLAVRETDAKRATDLYESVLRTNPFQTTALVNLGSLYAKAGNVGGAGNLWERALLANPAIEEAVMNLTQIRPAASARKLLESYLLFNPASRNAKHRLRDSVGAK